MHLEMHAFPERIKSVPVHFGGEMYPYILSHPKSVPVHFLGGMYQYIYLPCYLLLNSSNSGRSMEGTRMFCFSPSDFASKKLPGTSLFCHKTSANQPIQSKIHPPLPVCVGLDSVRVSATWVHFHLIPENAGHVVNVFPFSPVCEPSHPYNLDGSAHQPPLVA
jgi:hypothetical protein